MTKRKFSGERLYKLTRVLVITISVLSAVFAVIFYYSLEQNITYNHYEKICRSYEGDTFDDALNERACWSRKDDAIKQEKQDLSRFALIAIGLPILFFGGTKLYIYLFPEVKKE